MGLSILALDPGLAACGACVLIASESVACIQAAVFRTAPGARKQRTHSADDTTRRIRELASNVDRLIRAHRPLALVVEAFSPPRHASAAAKLGMAYACISTLAEVHGLSLIAVTPQDARRTLLGRSGADKSALASLVHVAIPSLGSRLVGIPRSLHNHAEDAAACALAALRTHDVLRMLRGEAA